MPIRDDQFTPIPSFEQAAAMEQLQHRVQSAIAFLQGHHENKGTRFPQLEPKFLRVGVNSAMIETSALARIMLSKQLCTAEEYFDMLIKAWSEEVDSYLAMIRQIDPRLSI